MRPSKLTFTLFLLPVAIAFSAVVLIPMFLGIFYSFTDWNGIGNSYHIIGFSNYLTIFQSDSEFRNAFFFTLKFAIASVILINVIGFSLALLVQRSSWLNNTLRSIFFLPNLIGGILLGFTWQFIFTKVFDMLGSLLHLPFLQGWLSTTSTGFWGLVIVMSWQLSGYMMIIYIAALQNISESIQEAASIDGVTPVQRLFKITLPLVSPAFTIGLFLSISNSFKLFDQNLSLTGGAPYKSTQMLTLNIYNTAFTMNNLALAQAKAVIFLIMVAVITLTQLYFSKRKELEL